MELTDGDDKIGLDKLVVFVVPADGAVLKTLEHCPVEEAEAEQQPPEFKSVKKKR